MKVKELIDTLLTCDPDDEVFIADTAESHPMCGTWSIDHAMWIDDPIDGGVGLFFEFGDQGGPPLDLPNKLRKKLGMKKLKK